MIIMFLLVSALPVLLRRQGEALDSVTERDDAPARLLQWAVALLAAERGDWGQAMVGELDRIERWSERWRFALGCVAASCCCPVGTSRCADGSAGRSGARRRCRGRLGVRPLRTGQRRRQLVMLAILLVLEVGFILAGSVMLRRPGVAGPGLVGGLFVAAAWLPLSESTIAGFLSPTGRQSVLEGVCDAIVDTTMFTLMLLPLATATIGWAAVTATARFRHA